MEKEASIEKQPIDRKKLGKRNKNLGSSIERLYVNFFKGLHPTKYSKAMTTRLGSRLLDNCKVDIMNLPINIQVKAGSQEKMSPGKELFLMRSMLNDAFDESDSILTKSCILIHHKVHPINSGKARTPEMSLVYMSETQFLKYKNTLSKLEYDTLKKFRFNPKSEFSLMVCMTFDYYIENIFKPTYLKNE